MRNLDRYRECQWQSNERTLFVHLITIDIFKKAPNAHFVHCLAHCPSLAVFDAGKMVPLLKNSLDVVHQLAAFIRNSGIFVQLLIANLPPIKLAVQTSLTI